MKFYLTRLIALLTLAGLIWGFFLYRDYRKETQATTMTRHAELVAHLGVVDALVYPPGAALDSARDAVFARFEISEEQLQKYLESFNGKEERLALFWNLTQQIADSLIELEMDKRRTPESAAKETTAPDRRDADSAAAGAVPRVTQQ